MLCLKTAVVDVGMMTYVVVRKTTYTYSSYAIGYDKLSKEIVVLPITADLLEHGTPFYLKKEGLKKAKRSWWTKEFTIWHKYLPKTYMSFSVPEQINQDPDNVCLCVKQNDQAKEFVTFFKEIYSK